MFPFDLLEEIDMFKMINRYGNAVCIAKTEKEKEELLIRGYHEDTEKEIKLDEMTVAQLEAYAKEKNIDLSDCSNKVEKLLKIKETVGE